MASQRDANNRPLPENDRDSRLKRALRENLRKRKQRKIETAAADGYLRRDFDLSPQPASRRSQD